MFSSLVFWGVGLYRVQGARFVRPTSYVRTSKLSSPLQSLRRFRLQDLGFIGFRV